MNEPEEVYWFIAWVKMRYQRNKLKQENEELKQALIDIRTKYQPIKKKIHGNPKRDKRNDR